MEPPITTVLIPSRDNIFRNRLTIPSEMTISPPLPPSTNQILPASGLNERQPATIQTNHNSNVEGIVDVGPAAYRRCGCTAIKIQPPKFHTHDTNEPAETAALHFEALLPKMSRLPLALQPSIELSDATVHTITRLPELDRTGLAMWHALHYFRPLSADYAGTFGDHLPETSKTNKTMAEHSMGGAQSETAIDLVQRVFNWEALRLPYFVSGTFHGVVFRSKRNEGSESASLYDADRLAHEEAVGSGGLLMYWYGVPDAEGMNLATCIWRDKKSSVVASALPLHREAVKHARRAYKTFELAQYQIEKRAGETGLHISLPC